MAVLVRAGRQPEMLLIHGQGHRQHVWPAEPLQQGRDVNEIQVRMIAAAGADQLERIGVAAFVPAVDDTDRAPPNERRPAVPRLAGQREPRKDLSADTQPGITGTAQDGVGTASLWTADRAPVTVSGVGGLLTMLTASHLPSPACR